jgi:hypothetical protein
MLMPGMTQREMASIMTDRTARVVESLLLPVQGLRRLEEGSGVEAAICSSM